MSAGVTPQNAPALAGRRIAIPESRQLDLFTQMLETRGAHVLRCPLVNIRDAPDSGPVLAWLRDFADGGCDDLILLTGEGLRRLLDLAKRTDDELHASFVARLAAVRKISRGPKPGRELRILGLRAELLATTPTTDGVIETLRQHSLQGRTVGVQLYGADPNQKLIDFLHSAGAIPRPVAPYRYADQEEDAQVIDLIQAITQSGVDAIAFTSSAQIRRLYAVARRHGLEASLHSGLKKTIVAAVGPLVAAALEKENAGVDLMPDSSYFMKPLVRKLVERFTD